MPENDDRPGAGGSTSRPHFIQPHPDPDDTKTPLCRQARQPAGGDLAAEFLAALDGLTDRHRAALIGAGIPAEVVSRGWIGVAHIEVFGELYAPTEYGPVAFITPVRGFGDGTIEWPDPGELLRFGDIVDLVAWHPRSARWALRRGAATVLGIVGPQLLNPAPVRIYASPLGWLRHGGEGLVLLTRKPAEIAGIVQQLGAIIADDEPHRRALIAAASRPFPIPPIIVAPSARRAA